LIIEASREGAIKVSKSIATIETNKGTMKIELYEEKAPATAANFIKLAKGGFYNGLVFHRVIKGFMIQGGDPTGTGSGGSKDTIALETNPELNHTDGAASMARTNDPNSASSQFFICDGAQPHLDGNYAVFGQVIEGIDVVRAIAAVPTDSRDKPIDEVKMTKLSIQSD
jgi:peptidyl-prolyl cis-trans isomerase B (cyclophilin B)